MAKNIKHVGKIKNTQKRVVVVFREIPNDENHCLVVDTDALPDWMHDNIISAVESPGAQSSANFYEYAQRTVFTDGTNMLSTLHSTNRMQKVPTANILMTPNNSISISLDELNDMIRQQNGGQPVVKPSEDQLTTARRSVDPSTVSTPMKKNAVADNASIAKTMLSQAEAFRAEAERLQAEAFALEPSLKPSRGRKKSTATAE
jgi:hypothetical protein